MGEIFTFVTTTRELVTEIGGILQKGESVVVLGHHNSGKVFLKDKIRGELDRLQLSPVISVKFQGPQPINSAGEVLKRIRTGVQEASTEVALPDVGEEDLLGPVLRLGEQKDKLPILLATSVDALSNRVARQFLQEVRSAVDSRKLIVLLTGDYDLRDLVWGANSEFNVAHQFVLQGLGREYFSELLDTYARALNLKLESSAEDQLWQITGGNGYALRVLLWVIVEWRTRDRESNAPLTGDTIKSWEKRTPIMGIDEVNLLRSAIRLIPLEPNVWDALRQLTVDKKAPLPNPNGPPGALTLSGIARRTEKGFLEFASPLAADVVCRYYDELRLGDLYARAGNWNEAFRCYGKVEPLRRLRPSSSDDRFDVDAVIQALCATLHSKAESGSEEVCRFFALGCQYILGFAEVTFWRKKIEPTTAGAPGWVPFLTEFSASARGIEAARDTLKEVNVRSGSIPVPDLWKRAAFALALDAGGIESRDAVLVGDFETKQHVSSQRMWLFDELASHFLRAHGYASVVERDRQKLLLRNGLASIINSILSRLGQDVLNVGDILQRTADGLLPLGYRRVGFSLVNAKKDRLEAELDASADPSLRLTDSLTWPLEGEIVSVHQKVAREGKPEIIEDASVHPFTNKVAVLAGNLRAFAVIPLLDHSGKAIGTMLIERADQSPPSQDEVQTCLQFGQQLAALIEQGERVNLMQCSLDHIPDPLLIIDSSIRVRYANRAASEPLAIGPGWNARNGGPALEVSKEIINGVEKALQGHRSLRSITRFGNNTDYHGSLLSAPILDWRRNVVGALAHVDNRNYLDQLFLAFENVARASDLDSLFQALLQSMSRFGHRLARIYLIEGEGPNKELVGKLGFGQRWEEQDGQPVPKGDSRDFICVDQKEAAIFCRIREPDSGEGVPDEIPILLSKSDFPRSDTMPGPYRVDFPLISSGNILGKVSIETTASYTPEHHDTLKVLCEMASGLLDAFLWRERESERKEGRIRAEAANLSLAHFSHSIATRFANLDPMITRFRSLEGDSPGLKKLNSELQESYKNILAIVNEAKLKLQVVHPNLQPVEATAFFRNEMMSLVGERLTFKTPRSAFWIRADADQLRNALNEIVHNAKEAAQNHDSLHFQAEIVEIEREGKGFVQFSIEDNGPGVDNIYKKRIFEDFFTHHPGREPGTGLGLSLVRRIVEAHRGQVRENGVYGQGARFEMELRKAKRNSIETEG